LIDLPRGFSYHAFSHTGETMSDGLLVPACTMGMAAFRGPKGRTILVRNHEMQAEWGGGPFGEGNKCCPKSIKPSSTIMVRAKTLNSAAQRHWFMTPRSEYSNHTF
jgi:secreted PhoX family phosphatase